MKKVKKSNRKMQNDKAKFKTEFKLLPFTL